MNFNSIFVVRCFNKSVLYSDCELWLKGQYRHDSNSLSTVHGIGVLVKDEHSDWGSLVHLCSSNGNDLIMLDIILSQGVRVDYLEPAYDFGNVIAWLVSCMSRRKLKHSSEG